MKNRILIALKALRQLGFTPPALNALYRFGLLSGHYKRAIRPPAPVPGLQLRPLLPLPLRDEVLAVLGRAGLLALLAEADEIVAGKVRLFGAEPVDLQLAPPAPLAHWTDYETRKISPFTNSLIPNFPTPDVKFIWEPARFGWAFTLGRAWHVSGDEKYAAAFWRAFEIFAQANPAYLGPNWMSAQEVGLRLMAFVWAAQVFAAAPSSTPARQAALAAAVAAHAARIPGTLVYARAQNNNHLLSEAVAIYTAGLALPEHPAANTWRETGRKWLVWCFAHQIDSFGEYIQHSANYHRLMLQLALWVRGVSGVRDQVPGESNLTPDTLLLTPTARENLALATHWLFSLLDPSTGGTPNLGANDGAQILPLSSCAFSDHRPVAQAAGRAFLGHALPPGPWDELGLWLGVPTLEANPALAQYPGDHIYADHSWGYLRALKLKSRPSHADQLHFDLWWRGLNLAQDAGTYLYNADPPWDNRLTTTLVHNTVSVDGLEQMTRAGRFLYLDWAEAGARRHFETGALYLQRISAWTSAYARLGVRHERRVSVFAGERWLVEDELLNSGGAMHVYRLHWLLPDWEYALDGASLRLRSPHGWLDLAVSADRPLKQIGLIRAGQWLQGSGQFSPTFGWASPTYAHKMPALSLAIEVESDQNVKFTSEFRFPTTDGGR